VPPRVYVETSVISYLAAWPSRDLITAARQQQTHDWWFRRWPQFEVFVSQLVLDEARAGDPKAAERRTDRLAGVPLLDITPAAVGGRRSSHRHCRVPWNGLSVDLGFCAHRECGISPASGTNVPRPWLRTARTLHARRADGGGKHP